MKPLSSALASARRKMSSSYRTPYSYDSQTGSTPIVRSQARKSIQENKRSFKERIFSSRFKLTTIEKVLDKSALGGWTRADIGIDLSEVFPDTQYISINLFVDKKTNWWAVAKYEHGKVALAEIPSH